MATTNRSSQFTKIHKVLKKHYKPVLSNADRPVLEHLLFACCLENAQYDKAEEAFAALTESFFDWNEIRVTSIRELSEVFASLPSSRTIAERLKNILQHVFEANYSFELEDLRKKNLGPTVDYLRKIKGTTDFSVDYVVQSALGGHAIPVCDGVLQAFRILDLIDEKQLQKRLVPGLERSIPKTKGQEFASILHQFGAEFTANPYSRALHQVLLQIDPTAKDRLPKRRTKKKEKPAGSSKASATKTPKGTKKVKPKATGMPAVSRRKKKDTVEGKSATKKGTEKKKTTTVKKSKRVSSKRTVSTGLSKQKPR